MFKRGYAYGQKEGFTENVYHIWTNYGLGTVDKLSFMGEDIDDLVTVLLELKKIHELSDGD